MLYTASNPLITPPPTTGTGNVTDKWLVVSIARSRTVVVDDGRDSGIWIDAGDAGFADTAGEYFYDNGALIYL